MNVETFLSRFHTSRHSGGQWLVQCPGHEDRKASLAVRRGAEGRIVLRCHAGCDVERIVGAMGLTVTDLFEDKPAKTTARREVAAYPYNNEHGALLYQAVRYEPKDFRQRRPDGKGGWLWNLGDVRRVPYRLPDLKGKAPCVVVEGEKDADRLWNLGLPATCNVGGAGKWRSEYSAALKAAGVERARIIPDNDETGRAHADAVARSCLDAGISDVRIVTLPDVPPKGDVSDYLTAHSKDDLVALLNAATPYVPVDAGVLRNELPAPTHSTDAPAAEDASERRGRASQATILVGLVHSAGVELFHTPKGDTFFTVPIDGHNETYALKGSFAREWLARRYYETEKRTPNNATLQDALGQLRGHARFEGPSIDVAVRVGGTDTDIYIDLGDDSWRAVHVDARGWRIVSECPVRFRRPNGLMPLPVPVEGGSIMALRPLVNVASDDDFALVVAWLVAALRPNGPYPNLVIGGEQGSAKSTLARVLRRCADPNTSPLRPEPRDLRDLMIAASNAQICCFDNLSKLPEWLSDALCRLATGGGFATRALYSDDEEVLFDVMRPVLLNGIGDVVKNGDLLDRGVSIIAPVIPEAKRRPEALFWPEFDRAHPGIFGALLAGVSEGLRRAATVHLESYPRMADFARWGVATEGAYPWPVGRFLAAYAANRQNAIDVVLDGDPLADCVKTLVPWKGTAAELLNQLNRRAPEGRDRTWPTQPVQVSNKLRRLAPLLRKAGVDVGHSREGKNRWIHLMAVTTSDDPVTTGAGHRHQKIAEIGRNDDCDDYDDLKPTLLAGVARPGVAGEPDVERF